MNILKYKGNTIDCEKSIQNQISDNQNHNFQMFFLLSFEPLKIVLLEGKKKAAKAAFFYSWSQLDF